VIPLTSRRVSGSPAQVRYEHRAAIEAENLRAIRQGRKLYDHDLEATAMKQ